MHSIQMFLPANTIPVYLPKELAIYNIVRVDNSEPLVVTSLETHMGVCSTWVRFSPLATLQRDIRSGLYKSHNKRQLSYVEGRRSTVVDAFDAFLAADNLINGEHSVHKVESVGKLTDDFSLCSASLLKHGELWPRQSVVVDVEGNRYGQLIHSVSATITESGELSAQLGIRMLGAHSDRAELQRQAIVDRKNGILKLEKKNIAYRPLIWGSAGPRLASTLEYVRD